VGVAAVGSVFFSVLAKQTTATAYGEAFASALAVAAGLQSIGIVLAAVLNRRRHRLMASVCSPSAVGQAKEFSDLVACSFNSPKRN
jgi:hypothetical protein